jgi:signal transduction histidine kinase
VFNRAKLKKRLEHERQVYAIRNNIAKDLHDEIGSTLSSIKIMSVLSSQTIGHAPEQTQNMLYEISTQSHYIQQKMSDIVWAIRPDSEKIGALTVRMREFIAKTLEPKDISVSFEVNENLLTDSLSLEARKEVLLIFKEAINNVIKHAEATQVNISLVKMDGFYCLNISDNGTWKGPDDGSTGTGLRSMKDRAASIGGSLHILTGGLSTTLSLRLPVT